MRFKVNGISKTVLDRISFAAYRNEFTCIVGQSGCGKTTLLNILAGFLPPSAGNVTVMGTAIHRPGPDRCVVFQEDTLFPWLTVRENIAFGLKGKRKESKHRIKEEVDRFLALVGLTDYQNYLPREISSGMKQRVEL
ncbi:MAG: ATP-binding cassette domain-containing protein, partial [Deltaproteobacteria bacterium]|nr:ATP-binding cassette domain-containing protein [Deltaproteobacteria bacterium]